MVSALSMQTTRARNEKNVFLCSTAERKKREMNVKSQSFDPAGAEVISAALLKAACTNV